MKNRKQVTIDLWIRVRGCLFDHARNWLGILGLFVFEANLIGEHCNHFISLFVV